MGGPEKIAKRRAEGVLNARERLDYVLDAGSFVEFGLMATSVHQDVRHKTPADGKLAGIGRIDGRPVAIVSNDFTTLGASSSVVNMKKIRHMKKISTERGMPLVLLGESTGARMPDRMGASGFRIKLSYLTCSHGFKPRAHPPYRAHIPQSVGDSFGVFVFAYTATWGELA
jgi:acetyl-CoA carboxylase carboxyltransferase component